MLRPPLMKVTQQQEAGSCGLIPSTGRSVISPLSVRLCFALTACRLPRRWWLASLLCRLPRAVELAAAPLPETPAEGDCPPQTASQFGNTALHSGKPGLKTSWLKENQ